MQGCNFSIATQRISENSEFSNNKESNLQPSEYL